MSDIIVSAHHDSELKQHKKKKRRRDETQDGGIDLVDEAKAKKKRRKHREESSANLNPPILPTASDIESVVTEKSTKKEKRKHTSGSGVVPGEQPDQVETSAMEANPKKKAKRNREIAGVDASDTSARIGEDTVPTRERKKKKRKHQTVDTEGEQDELEIAGPSTLALPTESTDLPVKKKKKKSKEKVSSSNTDSTTITLPSSVGAPVTNSHSLSNTNMFPLPKFPPYPGAQPNVSLFPTLTNLPFSGPAFGSNEDVLRALQGLDLSKIAGVLQTLSDAADAANVPLTGIPSSSKPPTSAPPVPKARSRISGGIPRPQSTQKHSKPQRTLDVPPPSSSSSEPETRSGHDLLLATKWMGATKLAELVKSEGLVYKKGKFSALEIKQVNEALEKYRTTRGLTEEDLHAIIFPSDEKQKDATFYAEITSALVKRPIIAVYHYLRRALHPMKQQGKWRPEEDARLIQAVTSLGQQWENIAPIVGRMATDCRDRYRNHIVDREKRNTGLWTAAEEEELTRIVTEMQKGKNLDTDVFWGKVTDAMGGTRSRQQCRIKWTDSLVTKYKNEGQAPRWSSRDAFILIHKIDALNVQNDTDIVWKSLPDSQWNFFSPHVLQRRWLTLKRSIKGHEDMTHPEIMDILRVKNAEIPQVKGSKPIKSAPRVADSDAEEEPRPGSSTGPGTLAGEGRETEDDSE